MKNNSSAKGKNRKPLRKWVGVLNSKKKKAIVQNAPSLPSTHSGTSTLNEFHFPKGETGVRRGQIFGDSLKRQ